MTALDRRGVRHPTAGVPGAARRDPLTGLGNRIALAEALAALDARTRRYGRSYCIGLCGLDFAGEYSGLEAGVAGDSVLRSVGEALRDACRGADFAYRAGGDEFVVVLPDRSPENARAVLERMRHAVEALDARGSGDAFPRSMTMSAGVGTVAGSRIASCREVLGEARAALRRADAHGRGSIVIGTDLLPRPSDGEQAQPAARAPRFAREEKRRPEARDARAASRPLRGSQPAPAASRPLGDPWSVA